MRSRKLGGLLIAIVAVVVVVVLRDETRRSQASETKAGSTSAEIAKEQIKVAETALKIVTSLEQQGRISAGGHEAALWSRRLVEATRKAGASNEEIIAVIKTYLSQSEARVAITKARMAAATASQADLLEAQYDVLEAKAWLQDEMAK